MKKTLLFLAALVTFASANALTYSVTVPAGTNACYIAGDMTTWTFKQMTKVDDTHYTVTIDDATETQKYKYCSGPDWQYVEKKSDGNEIDNRTYSESDVVVKWASVFEYDESAPVTYSIKHPWKDGAKTSWSYKELTANGDGTYSIRDIYGGNGCNWKSNTSGDNWIEKPTLVGDPAVGDSAIFTLTSVEGSGAITITKIETASSGDTGGDTGGGTSGDVTNEITIRVQIPEELSGWEYTVTPNLYYWTTEKDGKFAEMTLSEGWYSYTVNAATINFIVVNGADWTALNKDSRRQTVNVMGVTASTCYIMANGAEITGDDGSSWKKTMTATDCNATIDPNPDPDPTEPTTNVYYLIGYINGADYGCGETDYENLGDYKFVDGQVKATFTEVSYVYVKTGDNKNWYLSETYVEPAESATATLKIGSETVKEKVGVPANVEVTFTLVENGDGTLTLSYTTAATALEQVLVSDIYSENGFILGADNMQIFTVTGIDVTNLNGSLHGVYIVKTANTVQKVVVK